MVFPEGGGHNYSVLKLSLSPPFDCLSTASQLYSLGRIWRPMHDNSSNWNVGNLFLSLQNARAGKGPNFVVEHVEEKVARLSSHPVGRS